MELRAPSTEAGAIPQNAPRDVLGKALLVALERNLLQIA
jgi:hypothetical protein